MGDLMLENDERILLEATEAMRYCGNEELELDKVYLTNKNLIYIYEKSNGFFAKTETVVEKVPLTSVRVTNGAVQVGQVNDDDYGKTIQLLYTNRRRELLEIGNAKKDHPKWEVAIKNAVQNCTSGFNKDEPKQAKSSHSAPSSTVQNASREKRFCSNCGTKLDAGASFCKECGKAVDGVASPQPSFENQDTKSDERCSGTPTEYKIIAEDVLIPYQTSLYVNVEFSELELNGNTLAYDMQANPQSTGTLASIASGDTILTVAAGDPTAVTTSTIGAVLTEAPLYAGTFTDIATFTASVN